MLGFARVPEELALLVDWKVEDLGGTFQIDRFHEERFVKQLAEGISRSEQCGAANVCY